MVASKYALISVFDKTGVVEFAKTLNQKYGYKILTSGGTGTLLEENDIDIIKIADYTSSPEILGGRVKTLHPKIHGGILAKSTPEHLKEIEEHEIKNIDLVVCNLYDFFGAIKDKTEIDEIIEFIDIGGPTMVRAAAKNFSKVSVIVDPSDYDQYLQDLENNLIDLYYRMRLSKKAFDLISHYDIAISHFLGDVIDKQSKSVTLDPNYFLRGKKVSDLRYGENPHQKAAVYQVGEHLFYEHLHGKAVSYNNILDLQIGWDIVLDFENPACSIIKHRTPCGVATHDDMKRAYQNALESDPQSAFGGVYCFNKKLDVSTANELVKMFVDTVIAVDYEKEALEILTTKEKMTILRASKEYKKIKRTLDLSLVDGGFVIQEHDIKQLSEDDYEVITDKKLDSKELNAIKFAWKVVKHAKSNAIVVTRDTQTLGIASGEPSRVDAVKHAIERAEGKTDGAILASDAFFPFPDSIEYAAKHGIKYVIVPKGSIRDNLSIEAAKKLGINLIFTNYRVFKH